MAKIPFTLEAWLKDKSQSVETRDGRIVHNIWRVKEPTYTTNRKAEVCALIDGEEDALVFFEGGRYLPTTRDTDNPFDLFIVTPEQELTKFEQEVRGCIAKNLTTHAKEGNAEVSSTVYIDDETTKKMTAELLELARKEIMDGWNKGLRDTQDRSGKAYNEGYKLGLEEGQKEALKDLLRWKKATGKERFNERMIVLAGDNDLLCTNYAEEGEYYISFSELEKLPKEY